MPDFSPGMWEGIPVKRLTPKVTWKAFQVPPRAIKHQLTCPFELTSGSFLTGSWRILVIPRNHLDILGGRLFRQVIGIPLGTNCAPLLADLFLCSYENEFLDNMIRSGHRRLVRSFNLCYRYMDDLIVFNNKTFLDYLKEIYPSQLTLEKIRSPGRLPWSHIHHRQWR